MVSFERLPLHLCSSISLSHMASPELGLQTHHLCSGLFSLPAGFSVTDKCNTKKNDYSRYPFLSLTLWGCHPDSPTLSPGFGDSATAGNAGVPFGVLLSLLCLKSAFVSLNILNST